MKEKELRGIKAGLLAQGEQRAQEEAALDACIAAKRKRAAQPPAVRRCFCWLTLLRQHILWWNIPADIGRPCTVSAVSKQVMAALVASVCTGMSQCRWQHIAGPCHAALAILCCFGFVPTVSGSLYCLCSASYTHTVGSLSAYLAGCAGGNHDPVAAADRPGVPPLHQHCAGAPGQLCTGPGQHHV
jgi:hypothetical protein